jgi:enoyl-CoA hydratase/carnithine racemase
LNHAAVPHSESLHRWYQARGWKAFPFQLEMAEAYARAACVMTENLMARDAAEGIGAFLQKRKPVWEDR